MAEIELEVCVGVIEWDPSESPSVFVGTTRTVVLDAVFDALIGPEGPRFIFADEGMQYWDDSKFTPDEYAMWSDDQKDAWLECLRESTTVPWVTMKLEIVL